MSKSKQTESIANQALRRQGRSVLVKPLDFEGRFIDVLISFSSLRDLGESPRLCGEYAFKYIQRGATVS